MNKKGIDYAALLLIVVIAGLVIIFIQIQNKTNKIEKTIGDEQLQILQLNVDVGLFESYLTSASGEISKSTMESLAYYPRLLGYKTDNDLQHCVFLNTQSNQKQITEPLFLSALEQKYNENLKYYIDEYRLDSRMLTQKTPYFYLSDIYAQAAEPFEIIIKDKNGNAKGIAYYQPRILTYYYESFEEFQGLFEKLEKIAKNCAGNSKPLECGDVKSLPQNTITIDRQNGLYEFRIPFEGTEMCYGLWLGQSSAAQPQIPKTCQYSNGQSQFPCDCYVMVSYKITCIDENNKKTKSVFGDSTQRFLGTSGENICSDPDKIIETCKNLAPTHQTCEFTKYFAEQEAAKLTEEFRNTCNSFETTTWNYNTKVLSGEYTAFFEFPK